MHAIDRNEYVRVVRRARRRKQLHTLAETRLKDLLSRIEPESCAVPEVCAVLGGRNDVLLFSSHGRRVAFEIFASASQVSQDLRLLEQCSADVKVAVILDHEIDPAVSKQYFRKKPDSFPFIWMKWLLVADYETICLARLGEIVYENASIRRLRRIISTPAGAALEATIGRSLGEIERGIADPKGARPSAKRSGIEVVSYLIIDRFLGLGVAIERLQSLYAWLLKAIPDGMHVYACGLPTFLITDLNGRHAIWSVGDAADDLFVIGNRGAKCEIVLCLDPIFDQLWRSQSLEPHKRRYHFIHTYREFQSLMQGRTEKGRTEKAS